MSSNKLPFNSFSSEFHTLPHKSLKNFQKKKVCNDHAGVTCKGEIDNRAHPSFSEIKENLLSTNQVTEAQNVCNPRRHSVPLLSERTLDFSRLSRSCSCVEIIIKNNKPPDFKMESLLPSFCKDGHDSSVIASLENENFSCRSSTSTIRGRNSSVCSEYSMLSVNELSEMEEGERITGHSRCQSDGAFGCENVERNDISSVSSILLQKKEFHERKSIFEGKQVVVPTECFFPCPQQGQSLTSFLTSNEFSIRAELDRENAHFCISEALIAAIEHMKCSQQMKTQEEADEEESDEEIRILSQRIRIRRKERQREKNLKLRKFQRQVLLSDGKTDTTTSPSASPPASSYSSDSDIDNMCSEDEVDDLEISAHTESNLVIMKEDGLSLSMASLFADADFNKNRSQSKDGDSVRMLDSDSNNFSAESVALSLLRKFSEKHLPKASDLQWIVTEQEAPQRLLPLPNSWPVSPDVIEEEYNLGNTRLRGNLEWAPPRPQIISTLLPKAKKKDILEKQKYKCAGCGMKIEKNYINRFRYCNYFGKYFCQCCHGNNLALIPGYIIWKWDFSKYYVSKFAWELLDQMFSDPLFDIEYINKNLYQKVRQLDQCRFYRLQLFYLKDFIYNCRYAEGIHHSFKKERQYIMAQPHSYSIHDFSQVKSGDLSKYLRQMVSCYVDHIKQCILCQAKGFICEICQKERDIIFKFQLEKVILCHVCGTCFHRACLKNAKCPRCIRIADRRRRLTSEKCDEDSS